MTINDFEEINFFKPDKRISFVLDFNGTTVLYKNDSSVREWTIRISGKKSDLFFDSSGQVNTFNNTDTSHILEKNDNYRSDVFI